MSCQSSAHWAAHKFLTLLNQVGALTEYVMYGYIEQKTSVMLDYMHMYMYRLQLNIIHIQCIALCGLVSRKLTCVRKVFVFFKLLFLVSMLALVTIGTSISTARPGLTTAVNS